MKKKNKETQNASAMKVQFVYSENEQVICKDNTKEDVWHPINFHWIPVISLQKSMEH